jgi:tetratricopeptide (TPR) repeat protein/tRNA A-37 threonylcarbamoyl transferase component Bud32
MAEQEEPVRRRVALKLIKLGMDTKQVIARFEAERQALALMEHPCIATVMDAGATQTGRPYFVMELVRGIKITEYCDKNNLPTRQRLDLFVQVCRAIQHAHQKGIIHRDIKPSNILVTLHDGVPVPKVIDFGIAKATQQSLTDKTLFTAFEQFIGTPAYMSPEQAEMSGLDIDTRSDIYSLGVLLYELLTGQTPFDQKELIAAGLAGMRLIIREQDPVRPSTRLSSLEAGEQTTVAKRRQVEPPRLIHLVRGDLDWIAMRCLEKDRTRRYETANGLAADIQRHLTGEAVLACPPTRFYRMQKAIRRNKLAFAAAGAVGVSVLTGLGLSTWLFLQERRANKTATREAGRSQQIARLLQNALQGVGPQVALGRDTKLLTELMDNTERSLTTDVPDQPDVQADMCNTIGDVHWMLGHFEKAEQMHRRALELQTRAGCKRAEMVSSLAGLGLALRDRNDLTNAETLHREVLELQRQTWGIQHTNVAIAMEHLALDLRREQRLVEAEELNRKALEMEESLAGKHSLPVGRAANNLALTLFAEGKWVEAEAGFGKAMTLFEEFLGKDRPEVATVLDNLAWTLRAERKLAAAEPHQRRALELMSRFEGEHIEVAGFREHLALLLQAQARQGGQANGDSEHADQKARLNEAKDLEQQALALRRKLLGAEAPEVAVSYINLGLIQLDENKLAEAEASFHEALEIGRQSGDERRAHAPDAFQYLVEALASEGKFDDVEAVGRDFLTPATESSPDGPSLLGARGAARARAQQWQAARSDFSHALSLEPTNPAPYHALAAVLAQTDLVQDYAAHISRTLDRFGSATDPALAAQVAWDCLLRPVSKTELPRVVSLIETAAGRATSPAGGIPVTGRGGRPEGGANAVPSAVKERDLLLLRALVEYRKDNFGRVEKLLTAWPDDATGEGALDLEARLVLGMAQKKAKHETDAQSTFRKALAAASGGPKGDWMDALVVRALFNEALALGEAAKASASVSNPDLP